MTDDANSNINGIPTSMDDTADSDHAIDHFDLPEDFGAHKQDDSKLPEIPGHTVTGRITKGGMGLVLHCVDEANQTNVVVKCISAEQFQLVDKLAIERFQREIEVLSEFENEHIVPIIRHGEYRSGIQLLPYYSMPFYSSGDLANWLTSHPIKTREQLKQILAKFAKAIRCLGLVHQLGVVHRDLKPQNIFVDDCDQFVIGDFGLAKNLDSKQALTKTIGHVGTTPYASPEQLVSSTLVNETSDFYSLGVILHQFLCNGLRPFETDKKTDESNESSLIAERHRNPNGAICPPSKRPENVSDPSLDFICLKCLEFEQRHRYQYAADLAADLEQWVQGKPIQKSLSELFRTKISKPISKNRGIATIIASVLLIAILAGFYWGISNAITALNDDLRKSTTQLHEERTNRESKLLDELKQLEPKIHGGSHHFEVQKKLNSKIENQRNLNRAIEISDQLNLKEAKGFENQYLYWRVLFANRPEDSSKFVQAWMQEITSVALENCDLVREKGDGIQEKAWMALARTQWLIANNYLKHGKRKELENCIAFQKKCLEQVLHLPNAHKMFELELILFESRLQYRFEKNSQLAENILTQNKETFSPPAMKNITSVSAWNYAWFLYQEIYDYASERNDAHVMIDICVEWLTLLENGPYLDRQRNIVYALDYLYVCREQAMWLRKAGELEESKQLLDHLWDEVQIFGRWIPDNHELWIWGRIITSSHRQIDNNSTLYILRSIDCNQKIIETIDRMQAPTEKNKRDRMDAISFLLADYQRMSKYPGNSASESESYMEKARELKKRIEE